MIKLSERSNVHSGWKLGWIAVTLVFVLAFMTACGGTSININDVTWQIKNVQDWVGVEYYYKDVYTVERESISIWKLDIPFTGNRGIIIYEGVMKYGIDASQIDVDVSGDTITLAIPESKIISHEIPEDSVDIYDAGSNIFRPLIMEDMNNFRKDVKAKAEQEAVEKGFPAKAREQAAENLREFLQAMPGMNQYTLKIEYK